MTYIYHFFNFLILFTFGPRLFSKKKRMKVIFFTMLILKSISVQSKVTETYATASVHRAQSEDDFIHEDYENPNAAKKKNEPLLIKNIRGLLNCMKDYVSINECDLTEWFA